MARRRSLSSAEATPPRPRQGECTLVVEGQQLVGMVTLQRGVALAAAGMSPAELTFRQAMEPAKVILQPSQGTDAVKVLALMEQHQVSHLPVVDDGQCLGVISDLALHRMLRFESLFQAPATAALEPQTIYESPQASVLELAALMEHHQCDRVVLVAEDGKDLQPVGIVTAADIWQLWIGGRDLSTILANDAIATPLVTVDAQSSLWQCHQHLEQAGVDQLIAIGSQREILGLVTQTSLIRGLSSLEMVMALEALQRQLKSSQATSEAPRREPGMLQQVCEQLPDVVFLKEIGTGKQLYINRAFEPLYGHTREESFRWPHSWLEAIHPQDRHHIREKAKLQNQGKVFFDDEYRVVLPDGSVRWIWDRSFPIFNAAGEVYRFAGINRDITERKQLELAWKTSQEQLQMLLDWNHIGWWTWQLDSNTVKWSPQIFRLLGYEVEAVAASMETWCDRIHPDDRPWVEAIMLRQRQSQDVIEIEYRVVHPNGTLRWLLTRAKGLLDESGQVVQLSGIVLDITDRKGRQADLQMQAQIIDQVHDSVVATDLAGYVRFWNHGAEQLFGYRADEMLGRHIAEVYPPDQQAFLQNQVIEPLLTQGRNEVEVEMQRKSGERFWGSLSLSLQREAGGAVIGMIGYTMDITDRKLAALELAEMTSELQRLYDQAPCGYHSLDEAGRFIAINQTELSMLGYSRDEVLGRRFSDFLTPDSVNTFIQNFPLFQNHGRVQDLEFQLVCKDGAILPVSLSAIAVKDAHGNFIKSRSIVIDISERVQLQAARQAAERALRISESQRRQALNLTHIGWWDWDLEGDSHTWSDYTFRLLGYTPGAVTPSIAAWRQRVHPDDQVQVEQCFNPQQMDVGDRELEFRVMGSDGSLHWLLVRARAVCTPHQLLRMTGILMNITARKQAQVALQHSEEKVRLALRVGLLGTWQYDSSGDTVQLDEQMCRIWGQPLRTRTMSLEEVMACVHPDDRSEVLAATKAALDTQTGSPQTVDYRVIWPDGSEHWVVAHSQALFAGEGAARQAISVFGTAKDITERKQAEAALQQQLQRERLVSDLTRKIRQSLDLKQVLQQTVVQVRKFLQVDRVILLRLDLNHQGEVVMESVGPHWSSLLGQKLCDPCFQNRLQFLEGGRMSAIADVSSTNLTPCHRQLLERFQVQANLVVPIRQEQLWGVLIAHQCSGPRLWQVEEMELLMQLTDQLSIAIRQSELFQQTRYELEQRRQMQNALAASEARFRSLSASAPIGIAQIGADGDCLYVNPGWEAMSGLSFEESLGSGWMQVVHPEDQPGLLAAWEIYLQAGGEFCQEFRLCPHPEKTRWVVAKLAPIATQESDTLLGHVSVIEDITLRRQAEEKIRQQAALIDVATDAILVRDLQDRILLWSQGAERLYGWGREDVLNQSVSSLFDPRGREAFEKRLETVLKDGTWQGELTHLTRDGKWVLVASRWTLGQDAGSGTQFILTVNTDISEKKRLEQQFYRTQRLESLGTLASGIAHDLNNVFTPILSISQLLAMPSSPAPRDETTERMLALLQESTRRGIDMVQQVLTFARGQVGSPTPLQVDPLIAEIVKLLRDTLPKSIAIDHKVPSQPLPLVVADATQLHQVIMNLCVNARDAMVDGGTLTLTTSKCDFDAAAVQEVLEAEEGTYVVIAVADTGTGIEPDVCDRIFEPFFTTKPQGQGTGLGLSTALGLVQNLGGFMRVASQPERGTVFKVYLPASEASQVPQASDSAVATGGQGETILVVDDEAIVRQTTQTLLERYGYCTLTANDGTEAVASYGERSSDIAVVLMDVMMPTMDGPSAIRALQRLHPQVKVLAASGLASCRATALAAGADAFISKPYTPQDLLVALRQLINANET